VLDEQRVHRDPEARVDPLAERRLRLLGRPGPDDAEPVRDPVDVRVDRDRRDPVAEDEHAVRGLRPDPGERDELVERARDRPSEPPEDLAGAGADDPRLDPVEPSRADEPLQLGRPGPGEGRRVREPAEQERARPVGVRVARALGEDRADEHLERVLGMVPQVRPPPVPGPVERAQAVEEPLPVERGRRGSGTHRCSPPPRWALAASRTAVVSPGSERSGSSRSSGSRRSSPTR